MEKLIEQFASQGLGYLIAALEGFIIVGLFKKLEQKDKQLDELQEKRVTESKEYATGFIATGKDLVNSIAGLKEAQQAFTRFIEKFQTVQK